MTYGEVDGLHRYFSHQAHRTRGEPNEALNNEAPPKEHTMAKMNKKAMLKKARGQGMTEYIIIVALIAIAAIGVITLFGDNIKALFGMSADALAGDTAVAKRTTKSKQGGLEKKTLQNFGQENSGY
jgi:Flp pilus assembly pilin Flp